MTLRDLLEFKITPAQRIINRLSELKWKMIKGREADKDVDAVIEIIEIITQTQKENEPKIKDIKSFAKKYDMDISSKLDEKFDMRSSLENSIIGWEVALKKTSNKEKSAHLTKRINTAKAKLEQLLKNTK